MMSMLLLPDASFVGIACIQTLSAYTLGPVGTVI